MTASSCCRDGRTTVGFDNFVRAVTDSSIRGPLIAVTLWTFAFALILGRHDVLSRAPARAGLQQHPDAVPQRVPDHPDPPVRVPGVPVGARLGRHDERELGFINQVIFGGADIPWLTDPTLAKVSVLLVNLWLGFPYMFLVCMGALQGIPEDVNEAAVMDGANPWQVFRRIKLPLLLVTVAPLLISSFAFNFNNFNLIYMLTKGGPRFSDVSIPVGHTDILISMVYKVAFTGQTRDYGLASAFTILIFIRGRDDLDHQLPQDQGPRGAELT